MRIEVAGAGAGKTWDMASRVLKEAVPEGKIVFCLAFTNAAKRNIESRLIEQNGSIPANVRVSTIHSFFNTELVHPYYHLLFKKRFIGISTIGLPGKPQFRNARIAELEKSGWLHQTEIPRKAKWVVDKKSDDRASTKVLREKVLSLFSSYCHKIIVDEAQDIDQEMTDALLALHRFGVAIELYGDPKQDVRGHGCFRGLITAFPDRVIYRNVCHRCPEKHLRLSNRLASEEERQTADDETCPGSIDLFFESDLGRDTARFVEDGKFGLAFISKKNKRFNTHAEKTSDERAESLRFELELGIREGHEEGLSDLEVKRAAYFLAEKMLALVSDGHDAEDVLRGYLRSSVFVCDKKRYGRIMESLTRENASSAGEIAVKSIEAIKGLEHQRCLFVLTTDLAPYLFGDKSEENKTRHLLYVALTRSSDNLSILVTEEVERKYPRERIISTLSPSLE